MRIIFLSKTMPFFTVSNHQKNYLIFKDWIMFWNICRSYFFSIVKYIYKIKSNWFIIWFNTFPIFFMWWKVYFFPIILINESLIFDITWKFFSMFLWFKAIVKAYWKHLSSLFLGLLADCLFFNHLGESMYVPHRFRLIIQVK